MSQHHNEKFHAFDTETPMGWLKVIATEEEALEVSTFQDILNFLNQGKFRGAIFFTFNLGFDANHVLKLTKNKEFLTKLYNEGAKPKGVDYNENVKIRYIPKKFLRVCFRHGTHYSCVSFYDIAQFFGGWTLNMAAKKYLGDYKNPIDAKRLGQEEGYYETRKAEVKEYCRKDAELTLRAAMLMKDTIENVKMPRGNLTFRNPISQAKIAEMYIRDNFTYPKVPEKVEFFHWLAEQAYHGGIFSTERRGFFDETLYSYDINSAYPYQMDMLPHWANGKFIHVEKPDEVDTRYGWFLCEFNCSYISYPDLTHPYEVEVCFNGIDPEHCESVMVNPKRVVYPTGTRRQWVTKIEYEWMLKNGFEPEMRGGVVWEQDKEEYENPFSWIKEVYYARKAIKENDNKDIRQWALKIAMNGAYGKTAQKKKGRGALTNFFYSSYITAGTRMQICDVMIANEGHVIEIATDSILLDRKLGGEKYEKKNTCKTQNKENKETYTSLDNESQRKWRDNRNDNKTTWKDTWNMQCNRRKKYLSGDNIRNGERNTSKEFRVGTNLGEWSFTKYVKALVIGSGIRQQYLDDTEFVTHARGLTYKNDWDMVDTIKNGFNEKEKRPNINCDYLYFERERPIQMGEMILHHKKLSLKDLGVFQNVSKRLQVNTDKKRKWDREYKDFKDILESEPMRSKPLVLGVDV